MKPTDLKTFFDERPSLSKSGFCRECGITPQLMNAILRGDRKLTESVKGKLKPLLNKYGFKVKVVVFGDFVDSAVLERVGQDIKEHAKKVHNVETDEELHEAQLKAWQDAVDNLVPNTSNQKTKD